MTGKPQPNLIRWKDRREFHPYSHDVGEAVIAVCEGNASGETDPHEILRISRRATADLLARLVSELYQRDVLDDEALLRVLGEGEFVKGD